MVRKTTIEDNFKRCIELFHSEFVADHYRACVYAYEDLTRIDKFSETYNDSPMKMLALYRKLIELWLVFDKISYIAFLHKIFFAVYAFITKKRLQRHIETVEGSDYGSGSGYIHQMAHKISLTID
jgi:hypothetical protein